MPELQQRTLEAWGHLDWAGFAQCVDGFMCAWADYDGFHFGPCPEQAPPYTHIWGWASDGRLVRGRIDNGHVVAGLLHPRAEGEGQKVSCVERKMLTWAPGHERLDVSFHGRPCWPETMLAVDVLGEARTTFIGELATSPRSA